MLFYVKKSDDCSWEHNSVGKTFKKKSECRDTLAHNENSHKKEVTVVDATTESKEKQLFKKIY